MDLKSKRKEQGVRDHFSCGHLENLRIVRDASVGTAERPHTRDTILFGLRRNGMLAWWPDLVKGHLVRSDDQPWAKSRPRGSHRMMNHWLGDRHSWLDVDDVPVGPDYHVLTEVRKLADHEESEYCTPQEEHRIVSFAFHLLSQQYLSRTDSNIKGLCMNFYLSRIAIAF